MEGITTELDAVNGMLLAIHEQPVSTLEGLEGSVDDPAIALVTLKEISRAVQATGWHFNTVMGFRLHPAGSGEIILPENCLRVDASRQAPLPDIVQRGHRLFDAGRNTFIFERPVDVDMILLLPFDEIIYPARDYIMVRAVRRFQARVMGSQAVEHFAQADEFQALAALKQAELENADYNVLTDSRLMRYGWMRDGRA